MYYTQLMLTKKCNQKCYYCTTHSSGNTEVDIDYLKHILDEFPTHIKLAVELTGGEIGLIENIDEVYKTVREHPRIVHIKALSNGLLRHIGVDWIKDIEYWEHLIYDIKGKEIIKFYQDLDFQGDHTYVVVTTENTTRSLIVNWKYFDDLGMFKEKFFYKLMNHKSDTTINGYFDDLCNLYRKLDNVYFQRMLIHYYSMYKFDKNIYKDKKLLCQKYPPNIYIDLETKQLGHCAMNIRMSNKVHWSKENLVKMMNGELSENEYCQKCYSFDNGKNRSALNNRSYEQ